MHHFQSLRYFDDTKSLNTFSKLPNFLFLVASFLCKMIPIYGLCPTCRGI